jgi:predicted nucleotide-binding protein
MPKSSKRQKRWRYLVFVSHSSLDAWIARVIVEKIESLGAECWLDEKDLAGGNVIVEDIIRGIDACHEAIVLISPNSVKSQWVPFEIGGVRAQHKRVTPILNNVKPQQMAPMHDIKGIDLNSFEQFLAQLKRRISQAQRRRA